LSWGQIDLAGVFFDLGFFLFVANFEEGESCVLLAVEGVDGVD
jgi:hypothetical protein